MIAEMKEALQPHLSAILGRDAELSEPVLLAGGASKEAWAVDAGGEALLVRRAAGSVIHRHTLSLADEFEVLRAAHEADVKVPRPYGYIADLEGREAFVMERLEGMVEELDEVGEPHPAIELGLWWLRENRPQPRDAVVVHGDYRIGNLVVREDGLAGVLDWEFAHVDDPVRDLAFSLVRAWRFGVPEKRLGGVVLADQRRLVRIDVLLHEGAHTCAPLGDQVRDDNGRHRQQ